MTSFAPMRLRPRQLGVVLIAWTVLITVACAVDEPVEIVIPAASREATVDATPSVVSPNPRSVPTVTALRQHATVASVTDGDTIRVALDGANLPVRLILVDTPEVFDRADCYGREASAFMTDLLPPGTPIFLEKDVSEVDPYGRLLRYVYLRDGRMVNELVVSEGYAVVATYPPDVKHLAPIRAAEDSARSLGRGLWSECQLPLDPTPEPARVEPSAASPATEPTAVAAQDSAPTAAPVIVVTEAPTPAPAIVVTQLPTLAPAPQPTVSEWEAYAAAECAKYQQAYIDSQRVGAAPIFLAFIRSKIDAWC